MIPVEGAACVVCSGGFFALLSQSGISRSWEEKADRNLAFAFIPCKSEIEHENRVEEPFIAPDSRSRESSVKYVKKMNFDPITGSFYPVF